MPLLQWIALTYFSKIVVIEPIAVDYRFLLSKFKVAYVMYFPRTLNYDARKLLGLGKLYGSRTWIGGYPTTESIVVVSALVSS
ncbi:unnamed protein product [Lathyrus oleraceus]